MKLTQLTAEELREVKAAVKIKMAEINGLHAAYLEDPFASISAEGMETLQKAAAVIKRATHPDQDVIEVLNCYDNTIAVYAAAITSTSPTLH